MPAYTPLLTYPLTPSEIVLLNGEAFAPAAGLTDKLVLLHADLAVSAGVLARAMLAAAFLACEQAGALRLEVRAKPTPFGPSKVKSLYAALGEAEPAVFGAESSRREQGAWPAPSLEASLRPLAVALAEVAFMVQGWLEAETPNPWHHTADLVKRGLAQRGRLETIEVVQFGFVKAQAYQLPEATRALAAQAPVEAVQALLSACEQGRPEVWAQLSQQIDAGLRGRLKPGPPPSLGAARRKIEDDE